MESIYKFSYQLGENELGYLSNNGIGDLNDRSNFYLNGQKIEMDVPRERNTKKEMRMNYQQYFLNVVLVEFKNLFNK